MGHHFDMLRRVDLQRSGWVWERFKRSRQATACNICWKLQKLKHVKWFCFCILSEEEGTQSQSVRYRVPRVECWIARWGWSLSYVDCRDLVARYSSWHQNWVRVGDKSWTQLNPKFEAQNRFFILNSICVDFKISSRLHPLSLTHDCVNIRSREDSSWGRRFRQEVVRDGARSSCDREERLHQCNSKNGTCTGILRVCLLKRRRDGHARVNIYIKQFTCRREIRCWAVENIEHKQRGSLTCSTHC